MGRVLVTGITFGVFMTEAIIHYNMGAAEGEGEFRFRLPPPKDLAKIALVTGAFSVLSGVLVNTATRHLGAKI